MTIKRPERWVEVAQLVAARGPMSALDIADTLGYTRQATSNICSAMARHGYLEQVGQAPRRTRKVKAVATYVVTPAGRELEVPPAADPRTGTRNNWSLRPFGAGRCELAECLGLGRR